MLWDAILITFVLVCADKIIICILHNRIDSHPMVSDHNQHNTMGSYPKLND